MPVTLALPNPAARLVRCALSRNSFLFSTLLALTSSGTAFAQDAPRGLSQLDFDQPGSKGSGSVAVAPAVELTPEQVNAVVADAVPAATPQKPALKPSYDTAPVEEDATVRARLAQPEAPPESWNGAITKIEWVRSGDGSAHFLPPRLKGPSADKSSSSLITTDGAWAKHNGGCQEPKDLRGACAKANALKELFSRFSGSEDVYGSQCVGVTCPDPTHEARLTGFAIAPKRGGEFRILAVGDSCHYQLEAPKGPGSWVMLEGVRGSCSCVPKSCS